MHSTRILACLWFALVIAAGAVHAQVNRVNGDDITSQPAQVQALRHRFDQETEVLRDQAAALRESARDPLTRGWATLALTEFEQELEHEERVFELLDELESRAQSLNDDDFSFEVYTLINVINVNRGRPAVAEAALAHMDAMAVKHPKPQWKAQIAHDLGVLLRKKGDFDGALKQFEIAEQTRRQLPAMAGLAHELNSIGMLHGRTGRFSDAALIHKEALALAKDAHDEPEIARSLRLLGVLYRNLDDEEQGSSYLREALGHIQLRNRREAIILNAEIGISLMKLERHQEAEKFIQAATTMAETSGNSQNKVNAFSRMAELELTRGNRDEAQRWVDRAYLEFDKVAIRDRALLRLTRVQVWAAKGASSAALVEARATLDDTRRIGDRILERAALDVVADLELGLGDAASAYATRKAHQQLDKLLAMDMAGRRIAVLEASLEKERADTERGLLERDGQIKDLRLLRQRYLGIALIAGIIALIAVMTLLYWRVHHMRQRNRTLKESRDQLSALHAALLDSNNRLEQMANTDALTGLANRRAVTRAIQQLWAQENAVDSTGALLIDLDHFKQINDQHGHAAGDAVLEAAAGCMQAMIPNDATLGRWGGEEFIIVLTQTSPAGCLQLAETLRHRLCNMEVPWQTACIRFSASIGIAMLDRPHMPRIDDWIDCADRALYRAKDAGRNCVEFGQGHVSN